MINITPPADGYPDSTVKAIYTPAELDILFDWLDLPAREWDIISPVNVNGITLAQDSGSGVNEWAVSNAVARLILSNIQERLPQWGQCHENGTVLLSREYLPGREAKIELLPQFLFEINWADSGPGFSWPESYYVTWLPGFGGYVVTASQDSPDIYGYTDEAIGFIPLKGELLQGCREIITSWWRCQLEEWEQQRWAYLFAEGEIGSDQAAEWADDVWSECDE